MALFLAGVSAAISVKLASSIDDVVWLSAFLTPNIPVTERTLHAAVYLGICLVQTLLALIISTGGEAALNRIIAATNSNMSADKALTLIAGVFLLLYTAKLWKEYQEDQSDEASENEGFAPVAQDDDQESANSSEAGKEENDQPSPAHRARKSRVQTLMVVAFLGSLDDLTLFVPMLAGKSFGIVQLVLGATISASIIVSLCIFITLCKPVSELIQKVPLVAITAVFAALLLIKGVVMN